MSATRKRRLDQEDDKELAAKLFGLVSDAEDENDDEDAIEAEETSDDEIAGETSDKKQALWHDDDDDAEAELTTEQRKKFDRVNKAISQPKWAQPKKADEEEDGDSDTDGAMQALFSLVRSTGSVLSKSSQLKPTYLSSTKQKDITLGHNRKGTISTIFHPTKPVLITTGNSTGVVSLFQVCNSATDVALKKGDHFLQDVTLPKYPISSAGLYGPDFDNLFLGSFKASCFYSYNLNTGKTLKIRTPKEIPFGNYGDFAISKDGTLVALTAYNSSSVYVYEFKTMSLIHTFSAVDVVHGITFAPEDTHTIFAITRLGSIYVWDLDDIRNPKTFIDQGCVGGSVIAASPNSQFLAVGSRTGIVNVYDRATIHGLEQDNTELKPLYTVQNLTTAVSAIEFNHDAQLMSVLSNVKSMSARLVHMRSGSVFKNFPAKQEMLERVVLTSASFSPHSGYLAMGTRDGTSRLYRLGHYQYY